MQRTAAARPTSPIPTSSATMVRPRRTPPTGPTLQAEVGYVDLSETGTDGFTPIHRHCGGDPSPSTGRGHLLTVLGPTAISHARRSRSEITYVWVQDLVSLKDGR
jgi:hypothetical protein